MNTRKLIELQAKNKSKLVKDAVSEINAAPGSWQTLGFLNPSYVAIDFVNSSLKTLSLDWYTDWLKVEIAYQISANVVELIDEDNGYDFDNSEYSEDIMRKVINEYVHKLMPSYSSIQKYYKEFLKEAKECCPDEFEENKENISVKSFKKLYEANKFLFGTENPKEVKKLFESTSDTKSFFET